MTRIVTVLSHRGGSGKTLLAAALAAASAEAGQRTLLVDLSPAGGAASLGARDFQPNRAAWAGDREAILAEVQPNLHSLRATQACVGDAGWSSLERLAQRHEIHTIVFDAPTLSRPTQSRVLARCHLAVLAVPADAASLKTLIPFCEYMAEEKNRPNRLFEVVAVLTRVQGNSPQREAVAQAASTYLAPLLAPQVLAENAVYTAAMAQGLVPYGAALPLAQRESLATLANHLLARAAEGKPALATR